MTVAENLQYSGLSINVHANAIKPVISTYVIKDCDVLLVMVFCSFDILENRNWIIQITATKDRKRILVTRLLVLF